MCRTGSFLNDNVGSGFVSLCNELDKLVFISCVIGLTFTVPLLIGASSAVLRYVISSSWIVAGVFAILFALRELGDAL